MYEDLVKEIHEMRRHQMEKLKNATKDGERAYFSRMEPDKLNINGKYVKNVNVIRRKRYVGFVNLFLPSVFVVILCPCSFNAHEV